MSTNTLFSPTPHILTIGTGAVGGFYSAKLAQAGARVTCVCRTDYESVKTHGLFIDSPHGNFHFKPYQVLQKVEEQTEPVDYILVGLKVLPEISTAQLIRPAVGEGTVILLLQNGLDIEEPVAKVFPNNEIISGLAFICVYRNAPNQIHHLDFGRLTLGRYPCGHSIHAENLAHLFQSVKISCQTSPNIVTERWRKLVWNAPFNPISVLAGAVTTRDILSKPEGTTLVRKVMEEICQIAHASGHTLPTTVIEDNLKATKIMKPYQTSMQRDYQAGRTMEIEAILGNATRAAQRLHIPVPHLETLYALLQLKTF
ncbi:MAG: 2-dehydropantoate 2-reductase [Magnetococcus sp. DMHC-6]